jgi:hypothetical protein
MMKWKIGDRFFCAFVPEVVWQVTDVGSRVVVAMRVNSDDPSWNNGPPYAGVEHVFDEEAQVDMEKVE